MHDEQTVLTVKKSLQGRWEVFERGLERSLADFEQRDDALDYARGIAATKAHATVEAESDARDEMPDLREDYVLDVESGRSTRRTNGR